MKLEPIYLAPKPRPKSMPTRRAWLLASGAFVAGAVTGACAASLATRHAADDPSGPVDPMQQWLRDLCADSTPIERLVEQRSGLYQHLPRFVDDPQLWRGVARLARYCEAKAGDDARRVAQELLALIGRTAPPASFTPTWNRGRLAEVASGR